jgi:diacylglycerol kinase
MLHQTEDKSSPSATNSFIKSFACAFRGIWITFKTQRNFKIHVVALCLVVGLGVYLGLSALAWGIVIFALGFVLVSELFNTAIERLGDKAADGKISRTIGNAKDIAAAAVLLSALTALAIGIIFLFIPLVQKFLR